MAAPLMPRWLHSVLRGGGDGDKERAVKMKEEKG